MKPGFLGWYLEPKRSLLHPFQHNKKEGCYSRVELEKVLVATSFHPDKYNYPPKGDCHFNEDVPDSKYSESSVPFVSLPRSFPSYPCIPFQGNPIEFAPGVDGQRATKEHK